MLKKLLYLGFIIILQVISFTASDIVPAFIWQEETVKPAGSLRWTENNNKLLTTNEFGNILNKFLGKEKKIIVFQQDQVTIEDFSVSVERTLSLGYLKHAVKNRPWMYYPRVTDPVKGLSQLEKNYKVYHELAENQDEIMEHLKEEGNVMVYVLLPKTAEEEEDRNSALMYNDETMAEIVKGGVWTSPTLSIIFTGENSAPVEGESPLSRQLLAVPSVSEDATIDYKDNCSRVYIGNISIIVNKTKEYLDNPAVTTVCGNGSETSVTMKFTGTSEGDVELVITFKGGSKKAWKVSSMQLSTTGKRGMGSVNTYRIKDLFAPRGFCYKCGGLNYFKPTGNSSLKLCMDDVMMQPLFGAGGGFGTPYDCVGFFTAPILAGIMVTLMFAIILYWALSMVMGIQTMDQFDDPKGPSISVPQTD